MVELKEPLTLIDLQANEKIPVLAYSNSSPSKLSEKRTETDSSTTKQIHSPIKPFSKTKPNKSSLNVLAQRIKSYSSRYLPKSSPSNFNYGEFLYNKGRQSQELHRQKSEQKLKESSTSFYSFKPELSKTSIKIVKKLNLHEIAEKKKKHLEELKKAKEDQEMKECYFVPLVKEKASEVKNDRNIFQDLYLDACQRQKVVTGNSKVKNPMKINNKKEEIAEEVVERLLSSKMKLEIDLEKKRFDERVDIDKDTGQRFFTPVIGRPPATVRDRPLWADPSPEKPSKNNDYKDSERVHTQPSSNSCKIFESFKLHKFQSLFAKLDSDADQKISSGKFSTEGIHSDVLKIITPILEELNLFKSVMTFQDFYKRIEILYESVAPHEKMALVKSSAKAAPKAYKFIPKIDQNSKKIPLNKSHLGNSLYERNVAAKELHRLKYEKIKELILTDTPLKTVKLP